MNNYSVIDKLFSELFIVKKILKAVKSYFFIIYGNSHKYIRTKAIPLSQCITSATKVLLLL
jgi:hypothetical protein